LLKQTTAQLELCLSKQRLVSADSLSNLSPENFIVIFVIMQFCDSGSVFSL